MKTLPLALLAVLTLAGAAAAKSDCDRIKDAYNKINGVSALMWGPRFLGGSPVIASYLNTALTFGRTAASNLESASTRVAALKLDPVSGDDINCQPVADKLHALAQAYPDVLKKYEDALAACGDAAHARGGACGKAAKAALAANLALRRGKVQELFAAEKANPRSCSQSLVAFNDLVYDTCARQVLVDGKLKYVCSLYKPKDRAKELKDAYDGLKDVKSEILRDSARGTLGVINDAYKGFMSLDGNLNQDNQVLFTAAINAATAADSVGSIRCSGR